jgi:hypothetical protein
MDQSLHAGVFLQCMKTAIDDLPFVSVSRLRASGEITAEMKATTVRFDAVAFNVALLLRRFRNGGSWSFFRCPCGRRARILRLYEGGLACSRCLTARGLGPRVQLIRTENRAAYHAPRILARLNNDKPARVHPRPGRVLDRRTNIENALRRSLIVARRHRAARAAKQGL